MKRIEQTVWVAEDGKELIVKKGDNEWYIPLSLIDLATVNELYKACGDVVSKNRPSPYEVK